MSDDTATVEQIKELVLDYAGAVESMEMATGPEFQMECDRAEAALMSAIEQQARTIAELTREKAYYKKLIDQQAGHLLEQCETIAEQAARLAECERDVGRYRYAKEHLRIGTMHYDSFGECNCEFDDIPEASIDAAIDGAKT